MDSNRGYLYSGGELMVMQYLIQRNDDYMDRMGDFEKQLAEMHDLMKVIQYNITELQTTVKALRTTDTQDMKLKEAFYDGR